MDSLYKVLQGADRLARAEIDKYNSPAPHHFEIGNENGKRLAEKYKVDVNIVGIGTRLMDVKIGQAIKEGKLDKHVEMSLSYAKKFLSRYKLSDKQKEKIINCVEAHHKSIPFTCKEAEVCANADCYRMLTFEGALTLLTSLAGRGFEFKKALEYLNMKVDEKWGILSLAECKKELSPNHKLLKELLKSK